MEAKYSIFMTGFGSFGSIQENPSSILLEDLQYELAKKSILVKILSLPVSYQRASTLIDTVLKRQTFDLVLGIGLHRGSDFRLETTARPNPTSKSRDIDGQTSESYEAINPHQLYSPLDIDVIIHAANEKFPWIRRSDNASGYVCEAIYHRLLSHSLRTTTPCLFLHIPSFEHCSQQEQLQLISSLTTYLLDSGPNPTFTIRPCVKRSVL